MNAFWATFHNPPKRLGITTSLQRSLLAELDHAGRRRAMARQLADNIQSDLTAWLLAEKTLREWGLSLAEFGISKPGRN